MSLREYWSTNSIMETVKHQVREFFPRWEVDIERPIASNTLNIHISRELEVPLSEAYAGFLPLRLNELYPMRMRASERKIIIRKELRVREPRYTSTLRVRRLRSGI